MTSFALGSNQSSEERKCGNGGCLMRFSLAHNTYKSSAFTCDSSRNINEFYEQKCDIFEKVFLWICRICNRGARKE